MDSSIITKAECINRSRAMKQEISAIHQVNTHEMNLAVVHQACRLARPLTAALVNSFSSNPLHHTKVAMVLRRSEMKTLAILDTFMISKAKLLSTWLHSNSSHCTLAAAAKVGLSNNSNRNIHPLKLIADMRHTANLLLMFNNNNSNSNNNITITNLNSAMRPITVEIQLLTMSDLPAVPQRHPGRAMVKNKVGFS